MRVGSLFTGIGGLDLGLERAGHRIIFQCEKDEYRRRVLARHWPGVPCFARVEDVGRLRRPNGNRGRRSDASGESDERPGSAPWPVELLCGGFPCQDLSVAGRRAGLQGERSSLFFEFARIADDLLGSGGWMLVENVPGLLSSNGGRDFAVLLATLAELGFHDLAWRVLDSRYLGVPQRRRRIFILARRSRGRRASEVLLEPESGGGDFEAGREARQGVAGSVADGADHARSLTASERWDGETEDFIAKPLGAKHPSQGGYRNDLDHDTYVADLAAPLTKGSAAGDGVSYPGRRKEDDENLVAHTLRSEGFDASEDGTGRGTPLAVSPPPHPDRNRTTPRLSRLVDGSEEGEVVPDAPEVWPQNEPETYSMKTAQQNANGWGVRKGEIGTLDSTSGPAIYTGRGSGKGEEEGDAALSERDTLKTRNDLVACSFDPKPDGPRYAACGDAVTVNVAEWIGRRLDA